jgi:hypothetical protein
VFLDGNVFVGNRFVNVHFMYGGGHFYLDNNVVNTCWLQVPADVEMPNIPSLSNCTVVRVGKVEQDNAVGSPILAKPVGCVSRSSDGHIIIKKTGRQHGFECKNSRVEVPKALGPFQLDGSAAQQATP